MGTAAIGCCSAKSEMQDDELRAMEKYMQEQGKQRLKVGVHIEVKKKFSEGPNTFRKGDTLEVKGIQRYNGVTRRHPKSITVNTLNNFWEIDRLISLRNFKCIQMVDRKHIRSRVDGTLQRVRPDENAEKRLKLEQQVINKYNRKNFDKRKDDIPESLDLKESKPSTWDKVTSGWFSNSKEDSNETKAGVTDGDSSDSHVHVKQIEEGPSFSQTYPDWFKSTAVDSFFPEDAREDDAGVSGEYTVALRGNTTGRDSRGFSVEEYIDMERPSDADPIRPFDQRARLESDRKRLRVRVDRSYDDNQNAASTLTNNVDNDRTREQVQEDLEKISRLIIYSERGDKGHYKQGLLNNRAISQQQKEAENRAMLQSDLRQQMDFLDQARAKIGKEDNDENEFDEFLSDDSNDDGRLHAFTVTGIPIID